MASGFENLDRELALATDGFSPDAARRALAAFARESVAELIAAGRAPANYERFVNGRPGLTEDVVELPGPITYVFSNWKTAIEAAIDELRKRVPRRSGRYSASFLVAVGGTVVTDYSQIDPAAEVSILNSRPYSRKMEVGENGPAGDRHFELARSAFNRRFAGAFSARFMFLSVGGGLHSDMPYILKRGSGRSRRKDRQAGQPITYPALVISGL